MRLLLLFLFLAYPMLELALLIKVGGAIGVWPLLGIIFLTAAAGVLALQRHGLTFLSRVSEAMAEGRPPVDTVFDSALVGTAGMMLIAPGLITDVVGGLLMLPPVRSLVIGWSSRFFLAPGRDPFARRPTAEGDTQFDAESDHSRQGAGPFEKGRRERRAPIVIEGEYERIDERTVDPNKSGAGKNGPDVNGPGQSGGPR